MGEMPQNPALPETHRNRDDVESHGTFVRLLEFLGEHGAAYLAAPRVVDTPDSPTEH